MKKIKVVVAILLPLCCIYSAKGQYDAQFTNYWEVPTYYNPASAGQAELLEATLMNRQQWVGFTNAPRSMLLSGNTPLKFLGRTHGVGAFMLNETLGLFEHTVMSGQYAYMKKLWKGDFSAGIQLSFIREAFFGSKIDIPKDDEYHEQEDDDLPIGVDINGSIFDAGLGVYYSRAKWYAGFSVTHILEPSLRLQDNTKGYLDQIPRGYYLMGGYNIQLNNPLLELRPSLFVKSTLQMTQVDVTARLIYNKFLSAGLGWRYGDAVILMLSGKFKQIQAGYSFDFPISAIRVGSTAGSHEIFIKYSIDLNLGKGTKNKHKSVRIL